MNLSFLSKEQSKEYKDKMNLTEDEEKIFDMLLLKILVLWCHFARFYAKCVHNSAENTAMLL